MAKKTIWLSAAFLAAWLALGTVAFGPRIVSIFSKFDSPSSTFALNPQSVTKIEIEFDRGHIQLRKVGEYWINDTNGANETETVLMLLHTLSRTNAAVSLVSPAKHSEINPQIRLVLVDKNHQNQLRTFSRDSPYLTESDYVKIHALITQLTK